MSEMPYNVFPTRVFLKDLKTLKKKYRNIVTDIDVLVGILKQNPVAGMSLGKNLYKIRLRSSDKKTGKRGGFRVIYYFAFRENIYLIKIYSKNIDDNFIRKELEDILRMSSTEGQ
jgi:mRNA-degrading endonuclease RelE of RelBE toxin-antitoxin system